MSSYFNFQNDKWNEYEIWKDLDDVIEWQRADRYVMQKLKIHNISAHYTEYDVA